MPGFIRGELEQKVLILYILSRLSEPVPFETLLNLSLCDDGINYFDFTQRLAELVDTGHVIDPESGYVITEKGRRTAEICEEELPYTVRTRCDESAEACNRAMRREEQVRCSTEARRNGTFTVRMALDDDIGNLMDLQVMAPERALADRIAERFRNYPERLYSRLMDLLLQENLEPPPETPEESEPPPNATGGA
ncbi:MAG: DUF4364 family protein [Oscillibacter sp.]|nr:DUF4364 family protein [Oscillibacter sp.]